MNPRYHTFILGMIKHGDKLKAYCAAYPKAKEESARKAAERLLRNPQIAAEINEAAAAIRYKAYKEAYKEHVETSKVKLLSIMKKREILTQIATCEMKVGRHVKSDGAYRMVYEDPRPKDIIRAIEIDTRLEEACNRARNMDDSQLSRFDIYIDGRPADNPVAPRDHSIPDGLIMLPKKRKSKLTINTETQITSPPGRGYGVGFSDSTSQQSANTTSKKSETGVQGTNGNNYRSSADNYTAMKKQYLQEKRERMTNDPLSESFYKHFTRLRSDEDNTG